jgi:alginate O-acetyltransferase complex protein AlgI
LGLVKKLAIADRLGLYADPVFANPAAFSTMAAWLAAIAWTVQIYCDFSGYSDLALGLAHLLGFHLVKNFDRPLIAPNIAVFWRRWHMSLSSWLRDYVYIPLGGSRETRGATYRNVIIVMTLAGLWHGAGWTYILFGLAHGLMLACHRAFREWCANRPATRAALESAPGTAARVALTFTCFMLTMVVFRTPTVSTAVELFERMFVLARGAGLTLAPWGLYVTLAVVVMGHVLGSPGWIGRVQSWLPRPVGGLAFGSAIALALVLAPSADRVFVYFQF